MKLKRNVIERVEIRIQTMQANKYAKKRTHSLSVYNSSADEVYQVILKAIQAQESKR